LVIKVRLVSVEDLESQVNTEEVVFPEIWVKLVLPDQRAYLETSVHQVYQEDKANLDYLDLKHITALAQC
uniref:Cytokin_check_N domain-containing protein n=1 Tax=Brugia timori TaxID=42155 RepID=A0A0R3QL24_9BILA